MCPIDGFVLVLVLFSVVLSHGLQTLVNVEVHMSVNYVQKDSLLIFFEPYLFQELQHRRVVYNYFFYPGITFLQNPKLELI